MPILRKACIALFLSLFILSACTPSLSPDANTRTPRPNVTENASVANTPVPAVSSLNVEKEALRGAQVKVWYPWFGAEASLLESQIAKFNTENEWGIIVSAEGKGNYSELFLQTEAALEDDSTAPQIVIAFAEYALAWQDH